MSGNYEVPREEYCVEHEVKKSRFIAWAFLAETREQAMQQLAATKVKYPDARHHCWAYLIGNPVCPTTIAMSDDGEPSGTAGKPILNVLQHKSVGDIMLVVVRYFGGIKLGAGGLVRAYSSAAQNLMVDLPTAIHIALTEYSVQGDFALEQSMRHWLDSRGGHVRGVDYSTSVRVDLAMPEKYGAELRAFLASINAKILAK